MENKNPKVLVATPIYEGMNYCLKEFLERIKGLDYKNFDILLVDNSLNEDYFEKLKNIAGIFVKRDSNDSNVKMERLISSRNMILEFAKENNYDFILMMDSDVLPPKEIITRLLKHEKEVVSGIYLNYFMSSGKMKLLPVAWNILSEREFEKMKNRLPKGIQRSDVKRHLTEEELQGEKLLEVFHPSPGCMLLSRKIFENFAYSSERENGKNIADDVTFIKKIREKRFKIFCDTSIKCDHLVAKKYIQNEKGELLHPLYLDY